MPKSAFILFTILFSLFCCRCSDSRHELKERFLASSDAEESARYAKEVGELGLNGIPIFNEVISSSIKTQDHLDSYAKLMLSLKYLNDLAKKGVYSMESVPILLNVLEKQRSIADSLITAETIKIITGVDVGYDLNFVRSYTPSDESRRKKMIQKWRESIKP
jgi:hypothetical protein